MNRGKIIFELKKKYSYRQIGELFGFTKQNAYDVYRKYYKTIEDIEKKTCDVCGKVGDDVHLEEEMVNVCHDCWKEIKRARRRKGKHSI